MANTLTRYHFSLGTSTRGPIGYCAAVYAYSAQEATDILRAAISEYEDGMNVEDNGESLDEPGVSYIEAYFNTARITRRHIDEREEVTG